MVNGLKHLTYEERLRAGAA